MDITNYDKAEVLAVLYNNSQPLGMGFLQYDPKEMSKEEAQSFLDQSSNKYFDYLKGRVMKIDLSKDNLETWLYNRDNGAEAAELAIESLIKKQ